MTKKKISSSTMPLGLFLFLVLVVFGGIIGWNFRPLPNFADISHQASGAIFLVQPDGSRRFICSGTMIGQNATGDDGVFLTARHCVVSPLDEDDDAAVENSTTTYGGLRGTEEVSFSPNEKGPFYKAIPLEISNTDDVALLLIVNGGRLPFVPLGDEHKTNSGDNLTNVTYALDLGQMDFSFRAVADVFRNIPSVLSQYPEWEYAMPVDGTVAPGSSGSGVFDPKQRALIGVAVGTTRYGGLAIVIPASRVLVMLDDPQDKRIPIDAPPAAAALPTSVTIPPDVFKEKFGPEHPFKLTVRGPDPQFSQGGYTFKTDTGGFELSEPVYYAVPVYIDEDGGIYWLTSTKDKTDRVDLIVSQDAQ